MFLVAHGGRGAHPARFAIFFNKYITYIIYTIYTLPSSLYCNRLISLHAAKIFSFRHSRSPVIPAQLLRHSRAGGNPVTARQCLVGLWMPAYAGMTKATPFLICAYRRSFAANTFGGCGCAALGPS